MPPLPADWLEDNVGNTKGEHISARSKHPGGVNVSRCDGSVDFEVDGIDPFIWNALSSAAGGEVIGSN